MERKEIQYFIKKIDIDKSNLEHIAKTGIINGTLLGGIRNAMRNYAEQEVQQALKERCPSDEDIIAIFNKYGYRTSDKNNFIKAIRGLFPNPKENA